jgi:hypothetical protein
MEITINGKRVVLRDVLAAKEAWPIIEIMRNTAAGTALRYQDEVEVLRRTVETWELPGDPADPASYDTLDAFREFGPLSNAVGAHIRDMLDPSKN